MLSVLLLSEDQDVLDDLRGALVEHQAMMTHTATTQSALTFLGERTFDIIFVDMDGAGPAFLALAKQRQPEATRIVVSGPVGRNTAMRSLPLANESLAKPCSSKILDRSIKRACNLQALKRGEEIKRLIASVRELPSLPSNLVALNEALLQEDSSLQEVASVVARDVAMSAKILRLVNSSSFGLRSRVENLGQAVAYLGVDNIRNLAFVTEAFRAFVPGAGLPSDWMSRFTDHSLAVSRIAAQVVNSRSAQYEATVVGMLHDVGKLVVADRAPAKLLSVWADVDTGRSAEEAEVHHLGGSYPVIGGSLLARWGMNDRIVEAVTRQRECWTGPARDPELADALQVAHALADAEEAGVPPESISLAPAPEEGAGLADSGPLSEDYLTRVGLLGAVRLYLSSGPMAVPTPDLV